MTEPVRIPDGWSKRTVSGVVVYDHPVVGVAVSGRPGRCSWTISRPVAMSITTAAEARAAAPALLEGADLCDALNARDAREAS